MWVGVCWQGQGGAGAGVGRGVLSGAGRGGRGCRREAGVLSRYLSMLCEEGTSLALPRPPLSTSLSMGHPKP